MFKKIHSYNPAIPLQRDTETGLPIHQNGTLERPEFMKIAKRKLTKKEKRVMAKTMYQAGWSSSVLKEWFSVGAQTICNWDKVPTPEALKYFEENLKMAMADFDMNASYKVKERILELLPDERNIDKLVKAGEFFDKTSINKKTQQNTQVNVYSDLIKKFQPEGWDK